MTEPDATNPAKRKRTALRVNIAGPAYRDQKGHIWQKDAAYHRGSWGCLNTVETDVLSTTDPIEGTEDPALFQTVRMGEQMQYRFDLPNGMYSVRILFAEIYWESSDAEQQDVYIQGKKVLGNFNIFDEAGHDTTLAKSFTAEVKAGPLEIRFVGLSLPMHSGARACAIEIEPLKAHRKGAR